MALLLLIGVWSCRPSPENSRRPADEGRRRVVAGVYPLGEAARRVGGPEVEVVELARPGVEPHDLELTSRQVDTVESADLLLYVGGGFQPEVEKLARRSRGSAIDVLRAVPAVRGAHGDELDPHVWLDPRHMVRIVEVVREALTRADPASAGAFSAAAESYRAELEELDSAYRTGLASCRTRTFITSHAAFGYLARRYDLTEEAIAGLSPDAEPNPRRVAELTALARASGVTTVFFEPLLSSRVADTLAREAGLRAAVLNPVEGLTPAEVRAGRTYTSVMRDNLAALAAAMECA